MTAEEKQHACLAEMLGALQAVLTDAQTLNTARWIACVSLETVRIISEENRVPPRQETLAMLQRLRAAHAAAVNGAALTAKA